MSFLNAPSRNFKIPKSFDRHNVAQHQPHNTPNFLTLQDKSLFKIKIPQTPALPKSIPPLTKQAESQTDSSTYKLQTVEERTKSHYQPGYRGHASRHRAGNYRGVGAGGGGSSFSARRSVNKRLYTIMQLRIRVERATRTDRLQRGRGGGGGVERERATRSTENGSGSVIKYWRLYNEVRLPRTTIDFINYAKYRGLLWLQVALKAPLAEVLLVRRRRSEEGWGKEKKKRSGGGERMERGMGGRWKEARRFGGNEKNWQPLINLFDRAALINACRPYKRCNSITRNQPTLAIVSIVSWGHPTSRGERIVFRFFGDCWFRRGDHFQALRGDDGGYRFGRGTFCEPRELPLVPIHIWKFTVLVPG